MRQTITAEWAFARYGEVRHRLPFPHFSSRTETVPDLGEIEDRFDTFIFDSFGVLNVGERAVPGAVERLADLRRKGKQVIVLTNAASVPTTRLVSKYVKLGFDFSQPEIISSRSVLMDALQRFGPAMRWAAIAPEDAGIEELPGQVEAYTDTIECDGYIFLSSAGWNEDRQRGLLAALRDRPRPLLIGNPDLVAPREDTFTLEPGAYAHEIADRLHLEPVFFGKPFGNAFDYLVETAGAAVNPARTLMLGDTLHTDVLGGKAAGMCTALVTGHGVLRNLDVSACIESSGIVPDYRMPSI